MSNPRTSAPSASYTSTWASVPFSPTFVGWGDGAAECTSSVRPPDPARTRRETYGRTSSVSSVSVPEFTVTFTSVRSPATERVSWRGRRTPGAGEIPCSGAVSDRDPIGRFFEVQLDVLDEPGADQTTGSTQREVVVGSDVERRVLSGRKPQSSVGPEGLACPRRLRLEDRAVGDRCLSLDHAQADSLLDGRDAACAISEPGMRVERDHRQQPVDRALGTAVAIDRPVRLESVVGDTRRRVVHDGPRAIGSEEPRGLHGREIGEALRPCCVRHGEQRLHPRVRAVRDLHAVGRTREPAVVGSAGGQQRRA